MSRRSETTTKVFVGSLPQGVTVEDLKQLFEPYGAIAECDISNRCGFLHLEDHDLAMKAITELNGIDFMGGKISVEKGRVKPRRSGGGGPMRGGRDRGGPYSRGRDFRGGPPQRNGFGGGYGGRDSFGGPGGRGSYDRPPGRGGYDGGYPDRRPPGGPGGFDDRRAGGYPGERRPPFGSYSDRGGYEDRAGPYADRYDDRRGPTPGGFDDRRPPLGDRRVPIDAPRGGGLGAGGGYERSGSDLFSRRDSGPKPLSSNGYGGGSGYGGSSLGGSYGGGAGGYGDSRSSGGYGGGPGGGSGGYGGGAGGGYGGGAGGASGGYGDSYGGSGGGSRGSYDSAYPPLPAQRSFGSGGGGGPGPRRDMVPPGRRY